MTFAMRFFVIVWLFALLFWLLGCQSYAGFVKALDERSVMSCIEYNGGLGNPVTGGAHVRGVTATGGATLEQCKDLL